MVTPLGVLRRGSPSNQGLLVTVSSGPYRQQRSGSHGVECGIGQGRAPGRSLNPPVPQGCCPPRVRTPIAWCSWLSWPHLVRCWGAITPRAPARGCSPGSLPHSRHAHVEVPWATLAQTPSSFFSCSPRHTSPPFLPAQPSLPALTLPQMGASPEDRGGGCAGVGFSALCSESRLDCSTQPLQTSWGGFGAECAGHLLGLISQWPPLLPILQSGCQARPPSSSQVPGTAFKFPIFLQTWKRDDGWRLAVEVPLRPLDASAPWSPPVAAKLSE